MGLLRYLDDRQQIPAGLNLAEIRENLVAVRNAAIHGGQIPTPREGS